MSCKRLHDLFSNMSSEQLHYLSHHCFPAWPSGDISRVYLYWRSSRILWNSTIVQTGFPYCHVIFDYLFFFQLSKEINRGKIKQHELVTNPQDFLFQNSHCQLRHGCNLLYRKKKLSFTDVSVPGWRSSMLPSYMSNIVKESKYLALRLISSIRAIMKVQRLPRKRAKILPSCHLKAIRGW